MAFRHDKIRGNHPITPKKGIKEVDLNIREKGMNDKITVSVKPQGNNMTVQIPHDTTNSWDDAGIEERLDLLRYLNIDANSVNGKKFIGMRYSELPKHLQVELTKRSRRLGWMHEKWRTSFGYRPNEFSDKSIGELQSMLNYIGRNQQALLYGVHDGATKHKKQIHDNDRQMNKIIDEIKIRKAENESLEKRIEELKKNSDDTLMNIRRNTENQMDYDAVVWVLRNRGIWKGSTEKTAKFLRERK